MKLKKLSLRTRIFIAMILLVLLASVLIATVAIYQYREETIDYHRQRLERKEQNIKADLKNFMRGPYNTWEIKTENIPYIFKNEIYSTADIHKLEIKLYDLDGSFLISSKADFKPSKEEKCIDVEILNQVSNTSEHRFVDKNIVENETIQSSYSYIYDLKFKPLAILKLPYLQNDNFLSKELNEFLERITYAYLFILVIAVAIAFFLSKYITKSLKTISDKINATRLERSNERIEIKNASEEISTLVSSYNSMVDELEESAVKLATSEREQAWREMAKQVAHEIKNPLTPMRLTVQNFQRKFDPQDQAIYLKVDEYSKTLIQQIDTMSAIASAFSNFAKMPAQKNETLNVAEIVKLALDIFNEDYIVFNTNKEAIIAKLDRTQLIRVVTNLVKNSIQAMPEGVDPRIEVYVGAVDNFVIITVSDNGSGVPEEHVDKIFEPKFTTKTSGMGLGLAMVKNIIETYKGKITFTTEKDKGTVFKVMFPKA